MKKKEKRKCPLCYAELNNITDYEKNRKEGNEVFECVKNTSHRFWVGVSGKDFICWHPNACEDRWEFFIVWKIIDGKYILADGTERVISSVYSMLKDRDDLFQLCQKYKEAEKEEIYDSTLATVQHIQSVQHLIHIVIDCLFRRARDHDKSKLQEPEKGYFDKYTSLLKETTYGSDEYQKFLKNMEPALDHHYAKNSHHPDHFKKGITEMTLIELIEMLCDWMAATKRHEDGDINKSIEINQTRFKYTDELKQIFINTAFLLSLQGDIEPINSPKK